MHNLFNDPVIFNYGTSNLPGWNDARLKIYAEANKVVRHYRNSRERCTNSNILVQILKSDRTPYYQNADYILENARNQWLNSADNFGISTISRKAANSPTNIIYPHNVKEYLVMDDSFPVGQEIKIHWRDLEPIKVLDHPYADLNLSIPNGKFDGEPIYGDSVFISINIPVLILQYRIWQKFEAERDGIDPNSPEVFLMRYPLVNILNSHLDCVLRNRLIMFYQQKEPAPFKVIRQGGVVVNDTSNFVDRSLRACVKILTTKKLTFDGVNQQVPQLSSDCVAQSLLLPSMSFTRSVRWVYDASRVKWLWFLTMYNNDQNISSNNTIIEYIRRRIRVMKNDSEFQTCIGLNPHSVYKDLCNNLNV